MELRFKLRGAGWASACLEADGVTAELTASYLSDALGNLLRALGELIAWEESARCSLAEEPGEFRWLFGVAGPHAALAALLQQLGRRNCRMIAVVLSFEQNSCSWTWSG